MEDPLLAVRVHGGPPEPMSEEIQGVGSTWVADEWCRVCPQKQFVPQMRHDAALQRNRAGEGHSEVTYTEMSVLAVQQKTT